MAIMHRQVPPGGWVFQNGNTKIVGMSYDDLVKSIKAHRRNNGFPDGNPVEELEAQLERDFPHLSLQNSFKMEVKK